MLLAEVAVVCFGLIIGSFLNVCIYRIPKQKSVVTPRSSCPACGRQIRAHENIPVLSFLLLRGRCRGCGSKISWVYPLVEALTALSFLLLFWRFGVSPPFFVNALFFCLLVVLVFIDLHERILPDIITLGGTLVGFLLAPLQSEEFLGKGVLEDAAGPIVSSYANSLTGVLIGGGFLWLVAYLYLKVRKIEGMGFGDVKMMAMVGAFIGWQYAWLTILIGSFVGAFVGGAFIYLSNRGRMYELPFGTFLGFGAMIVTLAGSSMLGWYLNRVLGS